MSGSHHILLYDGACGLCHRSVRYVLRHDDKALFRFVPLQSELASTLLKQNEITNWTMSTLYVIRQSEGDLRVVLDRSRAVFFILSQVGGGWAWVRVFRIIPTPLTNLVYRAFARVRYRLFGRHISCPLPSQEHRERFLGVSETPSLQDQ